MLPTPPPLRPPPRPRRLLSSFQEATLPQTHLFKTAPRLFLSAGFVALILLSGFPRHSQRYFFIASTEGCGCLSVLPRSGDSEPGCLLQHPVLGPSSGPSSGPLGI